MVLDDVKLLVGLKIAEIRLGGEVDLSSHSGEVEVADVSNHKMNVTHMLHQLIFSLFVSVQLLEFLNKRLRNGHQGLFGPRQEPINGALVEESGEFSETISEFLTNWGEAQAHMQVVSDSINKVGIELTGGRISSLEFLNIVISSITEEGFFLILGKESGNLASGENHIDVLQELFFLDFRVSEDEAAVFTESTCYLKIFLYVFLEVLLGVVLYQLDLFVLHSLDEG